MDYNYRGYDAPDNIRETDMDSFIEIELYSDKSFMAGEALYGTVHLYCKDNIPDVKQVSLTFHGEEQVTVHLNEGGQVKPVVK